MLEPLVAIMARLRDPEHGCPWDRAQNFASIAPYTIEEAYEVADAIARGDMGDLVDELGDLLLQVVFHARMAEEAGAFAIGEVVAAICAKMERRHPHIFGDTPAADAADVVANWEAIKAAERAGDASALDGVALALPALMRAEKLQKRAARAGFDGSAPGVDFAAKLEQLDAAETDADRAAAGGDLLFAAVSRLRHRGVDPEAALRDANARFKRRVRAMEVLGGPP